MSRDAARAAARSTREACPASEALTCVIPRILNLIAYVTCTLSKSQPFQASGSCRQHGPPGKNGSLPASIIGNGVRGCKPR